MLSRTKQWLGVGFLWAAPLLLLFQYVGNFPKTPIWTTLCYLALFLGGLWLGTHPESADDEGDSSTLRRFAVGGGLGLIGAVGLALGLSRIFDVGFVLEWFQGGGWLSNRPGLVLVPTLAAWPLAFGIPLLRGRSIEPETYVRLGALLALPLLALLGTGINYQGLTILVGTDLTTQIFAAGAGVILVVAVVYPGLRTPLLLGLVLVAGLLLRGLGLWTWEIDPSTRDMLALVQSAQEAFLGGENPYQVYQMQKGSEVPLTYLPGMWLLYLFPRFLEMDIRWMGLVADVAVVASLWWVAGGMRSENGDGKTWPEAVAVALGTVWLFLPTVHWNGIYAEPHLWWGILAIWLASVLRRRWWIAAVLTGLAVTTRHFGVVVLPFVLVALLRDLGWRRAVPRLALAGGVAAAALIPFLAADAHTFWFGTFQWLQEYGPEHQNWFYNKLGFSGPLYEAGLHHWSIRIQLASVALLAGAYALWPREAEFRGRTFIGFAGTAYVLFVVFNGIIWSSFYLGAFLFVGLALAHAPRSDGADRHGDPVAPRWWWVSAGVFAATVVAGGWAAYTLVQFHSQHGIEEVRQQLSGNLEQDDLLIDRTERELEFVDDKSALSFPDTPSGPTVADHLFSKQLLLNDRPRDVWVAARTSWNRAYLDRVARLGDVESRTQHGHYTLLHLRVPPVHSRLSRELPRLSPTWKPKNGGSTRKYRKKTKKGAPVWKAADLPSWVEVKPKKCKIGPLRERILYAHPNEKAIVQLNWSGVELGRTMLVYGGIENPAIRWDRGDVQVDLHIDGDRRRTLELRNRPGPWWMVVDTSEWAGETHRVTFAVHAPDDRQRWTCLEAAILGSRPSD